VGRGCSCGYGIGLDFAHLTWLKHFAVISPFRAFAPEEITGLKTMVRAARRASAVEVGCALERAVYSLRPYRVYLVLSVTILRNGAKRQCEPPSAHWDVVRLCLKVYSGAHSSVGGISGSSARSERAGPAADSSVSVWRAVLHRARRRRTARCATLLVADG
jgi:hypothetical protein